ncbi:MAG: hypothetical protein GX428_10115 [Candidatus Atribacteria bacterium]|nr:hypothetical protein [Candidatus Atribacteria bacterium]
MRIFPFKTNLWDRIFLSIVIMFAIHLLWVRFIEAYAPLSIATVGTLVFTAYVIIFG